MTCLKCSVFLSALLMQADGILNEKRDDPLACWGDNFRDDLVVRPRGFEPLTC